MNKKGIKFKDEQHYAKNQLNNQLTIFDYNDNLPAIRCYHCNRPLSAHFEKLVSAVSPVKYFEQHPELDRYCCKLVLLNDYLVWNSVKNKTVQPESFEEHEHNEFCNHGAEATETQTEEPLL